MYTRVVKLPKNKSFFLFGPRQVGKTSLIRNRFPEEEIFEVNLLKPRVFHRYIANIGLLESEIKNLSTKISHVFIDEVQRIPEILNIVHDLIESDCKQTFILTGSSARKLKRGGANFLGGRAWNLNLHPICHKELKENNLADRLSLSEILEFGTLPAILSFGDKLEKTETLRSYVDIYLKEEIGEEALTRKLDSFIQFLQCAAQMNAEQINFSNIARDTTTNANLVKNYYSILADTLLGRFLYSYHASERKRHKTSPKFYFFDTGVLRAIQSKLSLEVNVRSFEYGNLFETYIMNEVTRISDYLRKDFKLSFLRTANDVEVDLIIETPKGQTLGVEIKGKDNPSSLDFRAGFSALTSINSKIRKLCVCTSSTRWMEEGVEIVPYQDFLSELESL